MPFLSQPPSISDTSPEEAQAWAFPKIATPGNAFRMRLNNHQIQRFSRLHQLPLFKWRNTILGVAPAMTENVHEDLCKNDERFSQCFCYGAPVTLISNFKSSATEKGVSNGTRCTLHAISSENPVDQEPFINPDRPAAADVWIRCPTWVVLATVDKFDQAMFPGCETIPASALTEDGRLLIYMQSKPRKKLVTVDVLETESVLRK